MFTLESNFPSGRVILNDDGRVYVEADGIRLVFREGVFEGWYRP